MSNGLEKLAFGTLAALWAILWLPLTVLFVALYVPLKALPCMIRREIERLRA